MLADDGRALIDVDGFKKLPGFPPSMIFTLLSEDPAICTVPENDTLGAVTQVMVRVLCGQITPYLEFYEFMVDRVLMGVPDFVPREAVDGPLTVPSFSNPICRASCTISPNACFIASPFSRRNAHRFHTPGNLPVKAC